MHLVNVVYAVTDIPPNSIIQASEIKTEQLSVNDAVGFARNPNSVVGQFTSFGFSAGEPITINAITSANSISKMIAYFNAHPYNADAPYAAVNYELQQSDFVTGNINNGDYVNIYGLPQSSASQNPTVVTIASHIMVLETESPSNQAMHLILVMPENDVSNFMQYELNGKLEVSVVSNN